MDKPADTDHDVHPLIRARWSPRAFADRDIDDATLRSLFEAARWAPSAFNEQPWRFLVARRRDQEAFATMLDCLAEGNQTWAREASVLLITVAMTTFAKNGKANRHAWHDIGLAAAQMSLEATHHGLYLHHMAGFSADQVRAAYGLPDDAEPVTAIAIGHGVLAMDLDEERRKKEQAPRTRRPQDAFVFGARWGAPLP